MVTTIMLRIWHLVVKKQLHRISALDVGWIAGNGRLGYREQPKDSAEDQKTVCNSGLAPKTL